jgi:DNA-binding NarL/FixJ family response regulator
MINVAITTTSDITRDGVERIISKTDELKLVRFSSTLGHLGHAINMDGPRVIIIDIQSSRLPSADNLRSFIGHAKSINSSVNFIILTDLTNEYRFKFCRQLDIKGFCLRSISSIQLIEAIRTVARGELYIHNDYSEELTNTLHRPDELCAKLTRRHQEVLELMLWGLSNVEISESLYITVATVKAHIKIILRTLGARDRAQAISHILQNMLTGTIEKNASYK